MALATLSIDVVARLAKLEENMSQAVRISEKSSAQMQAALDRIGGAAGKMGGLIAGAFTISEITSFVRDTYEAIDALNDVKDATGSSIEYISALESVAIRTGGSLNDVAGVLVKFNAVLKEADGKNGVSMALKAIGLDAAELRKMDPALALQVTAKALAGFADDGNKARIVQDLFGKSIREAAPFLNDLAEAGELHAKVTTEQAAQTDHLNKQMFQLRGTVRDFTRDLLTEAVPAINEYIDRVKNLENNVRLRGLEITAREAAASVRTVVSQLEAFEDAAKKEPYNRSYRERLEQLRVEYAEVQAASQAASDELKRALGAAPTSGFGAGRGLLAPELPRPSIGEAPAAAAREKRAKAERESEAARYLDSLRKQLQGLKDLSAEETVLADIQAGRIKGVNAQQAGLMLDQAALIDQAKARKKASDELDELFESGMREWQERRDGWREEANRLFEASLTPAEKLAAELQNINELYRTGAFGEVGSGEALSKVGKVIDATKASADKLTDGAKEMAEAFKDAIFEGKDLSKALEAIAMKRLIFEPLSKSIDGFFSSIAKGMSSGGGGGSAGGAAGGGFDYASAALQLGSMFFGGFFEDGGYLGPGKWGIAGEAGPEPIFGGKTGLTVVPNKAVQSSGAPSYVIHAPVHIGQIGSNVSRTDLALAMDAASRQTEARILYSMRTKGRFSGS